MELIKNMASIVYSIIETLFLFLYPTTEQQKWKITPKMKVIPKQLKIISVYDRLANQS